MDFDEDPDTVCVERLGGFNDVEVSEFIERIPVEVSSLSELEVVSFSLSPSRS